MEFHSTVAETKVCVEAENSLSVLNMPTAGTTPARYSPEESLVMLAQFCFGALLCSQVTPRSLEVYMPPVDSTLFIPAARFIPVQSLVMLYHGCGEGALVCVQLKPESPEVQMPPGLATAAKYIPVLSLAMLYQFPF